MSSPVEVAPSWDEINLAARALILPKFDLDLSQLGLAHRMKYEEFEALFYHLFVLIDSQETRRRFKGPHPAMDQDGRTRFIESAVRFINDKQLHGQRVSSSQLRMFGGETFRRLIGSLIRIASEKETASLMSRQSIEEQVAFEQAAVDLEASLNYAEELKRTILQDERDLKELRDTLGQLRTKLTDIKQSEEERWHNLARKLKGYSSPRDPSQALDMCTGLLSRLEAASSEFKLAMEKLKSMQLLEDNGKRLQDKYQNNNEKRLSQFIREAKAHLNPNNQSEDSNRLNLGDKMRQQLSDYDERMARWLEMLREEDDLADEMLLKNRENLDRYKQLEKIFPLVSLTPITASPETFEAPTSDSIAQVLKVYSGSDCDCQQALKIYHAVLNKKTKSE